MQILIIAPQFPPVIGGIATYSYAVAKSLAACGEEITVLTVAPVVKSSLTTKQGYHLVSVSWPGPLFGIKFLIGKAIRIVLLFVYAIWLSISRKIDLIYCTHYEGATGARIITKLCGIPYFMTAHGAEITEPGGVTGKLVRFSLDGCCGVVVLARRQRIDLLKLGVSSDKIHHVTMGVDVNKFHPVSGDNEIIERLELHDKKVILTVGNLVERKGHDMVIQSLPEVLKMVPNVVYLIVGTGERKQHLKQMVADLDLGNQVIFVGRVTDMELSEYYRACDVFIMPSREVGGNVEGFGIVFLEANACSKPVIGGKSGGIGDAVADGFSGILVDPVSIGEISQGLITLLTDDYLAKKLGTQGRKRVEERFSDLAMAGKISQLFNDVIKKRKVS